MNQMFRFKVYNIKYLNIILYYTFINHRHVFILFCNKVFAEMSALPIHLLNFALFRKVIIQNLKKNK
jgi:hypothetical protein